MDNHMAKVKTLLTEYLLAIHNGVYTGSPFATAAEELLMDLTDDINKLLLTDGFGVTKEKS